MIGNSTNKFYSLSKRLEDSVKDQTKSDFEKRIVGYSESLKTVVAKDKATKGTNWVTDFTHKMLSKDGRNMSIKQVMNPLLLDISKAEGNLAKTTNAQEVALIGEALNMMKADAMYIKKRLGGQTQLFANAASGMAQMELKTHNQIELPLQYLETIFCNSRQIMDYDTTEARQILKARMVKKIEMEGKVYEFPEAMNNAELMDAILGAGNKKKVLTITSADVGNNAEKPGVVDLFKKFGPDAIDGVHRFNPVIKVVSVTITEDTVDKKLTPDSRNDMATQATWASRGQFNLVVESAAKKGYNVSGHANFSTGEFRFLTTTGVKSFDIELSLVGGTFRDSFTVAETREEKYIIVDQSVDAKYTWNPYDVTDKLTLESIDTLMSATSMIYETIINVKDYYAFKSIDDEFKVVRELIALAGYAGRTTNIMVQDGTASGTPDAGYHPTSKIGWRNEMIPEAMRLMCVEYRDKFHSRVGLKTVFYGRPAVTSLIGNLVVVIQAGQEYGGVTTDYSVKSGTVNDEHQVRIVATERVDKAYGTKLKAIAKSDSENQEGFKFYQWMTLFCKNGEIRDPENPAAACIVYTDSFKVENMFAVGGELTLTGM